MNVRNRRILFTGVGQVELGVERFSPPEALCRDELLLRMEFTLISPGTEIDCLLNRTGDVRYPKCLGYSAVAKVLECGSEVTGFQEGDRVLVYHSCHSEYLVKKQHDLVKVPDGLAGEEAVFCVVGAMGFQGVRKIRPELGESVMVMGLGLLGQVAVQTAALSGAFPLIATDFNPLRREIALKHGADRVFAPDDPELKRKVMEATRGRGIDGLVEVTGSPRALNQGLELMAPLGRIALVGCSRTPTESLDFYHLVHRPGVQIIGAHNFVRPADQSRPGYWTMRDDMRVLMELTLAGRLDMRSLLTEVNEPENAPAVYQRFLDKDPAALGMVFDWRS